MISGVVVELDGHDPLVVARRVSHDVSEVAIEGEKNRAHLLRLGDDRRVKRTDGQDLAQQSDLVPITSEDVRDLRRHALVAEETPAHTLTASTSARSRA